MNRPNNPRSPGTARGSRRSGGDPGGGGTGPGVGCMAGVVRFFRGLFWLAVIVLALYVAVVMFA